MVNETLIVRKKEKNKTTIFKVKKSFKGEHRDTDYKNQIDIRDYRQLALLFGDLKTLFDAPIEKAIKEMKKEQSPFW